MPNKIINTVSRLFQPMNTIPKNLEAKQSSINSKSYNLMLDTGIIKQVNPGMYALLPLGLNALEKLINLIEGEMAKIGAQKIHLPSLTSTNLWKKTKRYELSGLELFRLKDRHNKEYVLNPTCEEVITNLISDNINISSSIFPLLLYQISQKYRDEMKPRLGLLRGREFVMKDLYSFDVNLQNAQNTYNTVCQAYDNILQQIGIKYVKAIGDTGIMGGNISHEYHYLSNIGEDSIMSCSSCNYAINKKISDSTCPHCNSPLSVDSGVEIGHTFLLDTKYSEPLKAIFNNIPLSMGCFGLGLTRLLTTSVEILSTNFEIRWPTIIAPYSVCIIGPKKGSKEEKASAYVQDTYNLLTQLNVDVIVDDRIHMTIGKRMLDAKRTGYPFIIVIGKTSTGSTPLFEVHDVYNSKCNNVNLEGVNDYFNKKSPEQKLTWTVNFG